MSEIKYEHIYIYDNGVAFIKDTKTKVVEIISEHIAYGWSPEEIHFQHNYLTLGQIYSAFAYYWDHSEEMEKEISEIKAKVAELRATYASSLQDKLNAKKTG